MWKLRASIVAALLGLAACSTPGAPPQPAAPPSATNLSTGTLHVEPFAIVFRGRRNEMQTVRVWENGYRGAYRSANKCKAVTVTLRRVTKQNVSIWNVGPNAPVREMCVVVFSARRGNRGSADLKVRVER